MIGFSFYLNKELDDDTEEYFKSMKNNGFHEVFTTFHSNTNNSKKYLQILDQLIDLVQSLQMKLAIDVDKSSLQLIHDKIINIDCLLRLDESFSYEDIATLNDEIPIALNASILDDTDIDELKALDVDLNKLTAWYNYYPRPESGLDLTWFAQKNRWLKKHGFQTQAFVAGNEPLRGPLMEGLPTLERHRRTNPFIAAVELDKLETDSVVVGDPYLDPDLRSSFNSYFNHGYIPLHISDIKIGTPSYLFTNVFHNRKDPARDSIRLAESRKMNHRNIGPTNNTERIFGTVTMDNRNYGRYMGEIQIVCHHLPASQNVNVLGMIIESDLKLLAYIDADSAFKLIKTNNTL